MLYKTPFKTAVELGLSEKCYRGLNLALGYLELPANPDTAPRQRFDMSVWDHCIRGWAERLVGNLEINIEDYPVELHQLFIPNHKALKHITREEAADALRHYLFTGEVKWQ